MLPRADGYQVCNELRKESDVPIIILTALSNISDRVMGLEFGADDYITKPFSPKELEARIRSVLRRTKNTFNKKATKRPSILKVDFLVIDLYRRKVLKHNKLVSLTNIEFSLLELLISRAGEKLSRFFILDSIWGYVPERYIDTRVVDVHISRLRSKLERDARKPKLIITARGIGYMFPKI
uniref:transcriptional regulatory protein OmpR n=1 Tax=Chrysotila carterae TaxID=13221 RepID=UPI0022F30912|nr:transcriptional regulatory protein OmpR [Chrysotila carterae]WAK83145.1 transcriptional regulatory protein OmpR [Chrysotila carterae]